MHVGPIVFQFYLVDFNLYTIMVMEKPSPGEGHLSLTFDLAS